MAQSGPTCRHQFAQRPSWWGRSAGQCGVTLAVAMVAAPCRLGEPNRTVTVGMHRREAIASVRSPCPVALPAMDTTATARPPAATRPATIRPLRPNDGLEIARIFRATLVLGRPLDLDYGELVDYQRLCLDWYLTEGRAHARVVEDDGRVVGYLLACLDQAGYDRWVRGQAVRWAASAAWRATTFRLRPTARRFLALRIADGLMSWWGDTGPPFPAHAHLNLAADVRDAGIGHRLAGTMDEMVEAAGIPGWFGEVNLPRGANLDALTRQGARVVRRTRSRTFSWALQTPVTRVTVVRTLADRPQRLRTTA